MARERSTFNITHSKNSIKFLGNLAFLLIKYSGKKILFILFLFCSTICFAQKVEDLKKKDSIPAATVDSMIKAEHSPRKAAVRSAVIPGWGQAYNKKYWKMPIIYAALGITAYVFINNIDTYKDYKFAYSAKY